MTSKNKRFLTAEERRERVAKLPADWHIAGAAAGNTMAGMPTTSADVAALRRTLNGESTAAAERARIETQIREHAASHRQPKTD